MKIISWNVNGFRSLVRKNELKVILKDNYDIICFQEAKLSDIEVIRDNVPSKYNIYTNLSSKKGQSGVVVLSLEKAISINDLINHDRFDIEGRFIEIKYNNFTLVNLYMPHGGRQKENLEYKLEVANIIINKLKDNKRTIIATDFNIAKEDIDVCNSSQNKNNIMFTKEEREIVEKLESNNFIDSFRYMYPNKINYTWWPYAFDCRNRNVGWRIDYFFITNDLKNEIIDISINKDQLGSDHCPLVLLLKNN